MRLIGILVFLLAIAGCQANGSYGTNYSSAASTVEPLPVANTVEPLVVYEPQMRDQFVFKEITDSLQQFGYRGFCLEPDFEKCFRGPRLNYDAYQGKSFYYETDEPVAQRGLNRFYPIIVENGQRLFHEKSTRFLRLNDADILPLADFLAAKNFIPEPLIEGSSLMLTSIDQSGSIPEYTMSNGEKLEVALLVHIRELSRQYPKNSATIAEIMSRHSIEYDKVEQRYFVSPYSGGHFKGSYLKAYLGHKDGRHWLRFALRYKAADWLFIKRFVLVAEKYRFESPVDDFERNHSGGKIWEWRDTNAQGNYLAALRATAESEETTIRFYGKQYYRDFEVPPKQRELIKDMLELHTLMSK